MSERMHPLNLEQSILADLNLSNSLTPKIVTLYHSCRVDKAVGRLSLLSWAALWHRYSGP